MPKRATRVQYHYTNSKKTTPSEYGFRGHHPKGEEIEGYPNPKYLNHIKLEDL